MNGGGFKEKRKIMSIGGEEERSDGGWIKVEKEMEREKNKGDCRAFCDALTYVYARVMYI